MHPKKGWHSRGYLPHFDGNVTQFVTFRLFDSLPLALIKTFEIEKRERKLEHYYDDAFRERIEVYLDRGMGSCHLKKPEIASIFQEALLLHAAKLYSLFAWIVMPNHVHVLIRPDSTSSLPHIIKNLKRYSSYNANRVLGREGRFWQPDYFDRYIRDGEHFVNTVRYIEDNPVKAGLCGEASEWEFSSANPEMRRRMADLQ